MQRIWCKRLVFQNLLRCYSTESTLTHANKMGILHSNRSYEEIVQLGSEFIVNPITFSIHINALCKLNKIEEAENLLDEYTKKTPKYIDSLSYSPLLDAYFKRKDYSKALSLINNALLSGVKLMNKPFNELLGAQRDDPVACMQIIDLMQRYNVPMDFRSYTSGILACISLGNYERGKGFVTKLSTLFIDTIGLNAILSFYYSFEVEKVIPVYNNLTKRKKVKRDQKTCDLIISSAIDTKQYKYAFDYIQLCLNEGIELNQRNINLYIKKFTKANRGEEAFRIYLELEKRKILLDKFGISILLSYFCSKTDLNKASVLFMNSKTKGIEMDSHVYTNYINCCIYGKRIDKAMDIYKELVINNSELVDDLMTHSILLGIAKQKEFGYLKEVIDLAVSIGKNEIHLENELIQACCHSLDPEIVKHVYNNSKENDIPLTSKTYKAVIKQLRRTDYKDSIIVLNDMKTNNIKPTIDIVNELISGCLSADAVSDALKLKNSIKDFNLEPNQATFFIFLHYYKRKQFLEAIDKLHSEMSSHGYQLPKTEYEYDDPEDSF